jgi:hypothetical protein
MNHNWRVLAFIVTPVYEPNATVNASCGYAMHGKVLYNSLYASNLTRGHESQRVMFEVAPRPAEV